MGSSISKKMGENMAINMENQKTFQKEIMMRQRQMQLATQQALGRQRFKYYSGFFAVVVIAGLTRTVLTKNPIFLVPIVPLGFMTAFQYDLYYGKMMYRVQQQAAKIIRDEGQTLLIPQGNGIMSQQDYRKIIMLNRKSN